VKHLSGKAFARIVQARGWTLARVNGSHHIFKHEGKREILVIPIHSNETLKTGTLCSLMKIAELTEQDISE
jgi:hypothetical protein